MDCKLQAYLDFKIRQFIRTSGFNIQQPDAKEKLQILIATKLKQWVAEAIEAGC